MTFNSPAKMAHPSCVCLSCPHLCDIRIFIYPHCAIVLATACITPLGFLLLSNLILVECKHFGAFRAQQSNDIKLPFHVCILKVKLYTHPKLSYQCCIYYQKWPFINVLYTLWISNNRFSVWYTSM